MIRKPQQKGTRTRHSQYIAEPHKNLKDETSDFQVRRLGSIPSRFRDVKFEYVLIDSRLHRYRKSLRFEELGAPSVNEKDSYSKSDDYSESFVCTRGSSLLLMQAHQR